MSERVSLADFNRIPAPELVAGMEPVEAVTLEEFVDEEQVEMDALLGTSYETILPANGMLLMYGDGGAGKTTLTIDAVAHLAAGVPWLGIEVEQPVTTLMIENEGPLHKFQQRMREKIASWNGHPGFSERVHVIRRPWTRFNLQLEEHRQYLALQVAKRELDLVVMGPLVTLGMVGGGTPDEVAEFEELIRLTRALVDREFALWVVHHENKAGDVSGAWERVPDALCHVQAQGNGHTRLRWVKARWADESNGTSLDLLWAEGRSFTVKAADSRDLHTEVRELYAAGDEWRTNREVAKAIGANEGKVRAVLIALVQLGELIYEEGPAGRGNNAKCYRLASTEPRLWANPGSAAQWPGEEGSEPTEPPLVRKGRSLGSAHPADSVSRPTGAVDPEDTSEPAF